MEIPELIKQRLGGEAVESAVNLGDEDLVCFTAGRTLIYRADGLLSDESVDVYDHDVERLDISEGRRKTAFELTYFDRTESFSVARDRAKPVLKRLLAGVLHASSVTDDGETVVDVFRFSELTVIITDARLVKHIGASVWDEDYAEYPFTDVTGLEFEEGSVATQIVLSVSGRPQRIKAPSDEGRLVRKQLEKALFAFYDVDSIGQLNATIGPEETDRAEHNGESLTLDDTISPLVGEDETAEGLLAGEEDDIDPLGDSTAEENTGEDTDERTGNDAEGKERTMAADDAEPETQSPESNAEEGEDGHEHSDSETRQPGHAVDPAEIEEIQRQLATLTDAVGQQNELLKKQHGAIEALIEELRKQQ
ncbi:MAG: hypothetical protein V5A55_12840 [Halovenus sp.]